MGQITIGGYHISIIRRTRVPKPIMPKVLWKEPRKTPRKTIKHTVDALKEIAQSMGYEYTGNQ